VNSKENADTPKMKNRRRYFGILYITLLLLSAIFIWHAWVSSIEAIEHDARAVAMAAKNTLDIEKIAGLQGEASDVDSEPYRFIKEKLVLFAAEDDEIRFVYLFALRGEEIVILADSETPDSKDYSPPGQVYNEADAAYYLPFTSLGESAVFTRVVKDRWGSWKSVLVPLYDPNSGELTAVLGLDYPVGTWYMPAIIETVQITAILLAIFMLSIAINAMVKKNYLLEQKREDLLAANQALAESENEYKLLISQMQQGLAVHEIILDTTGKPVDYRFISMNKSFEEQTGLVGNEIVGKTVLQVLPNTEQYWLDNYAEVALTGEPLEYENYSRELDKYFHVNAFSPQKNRFAVIVTDITARKKTDNTLRESEEKYRNIFDYSPVGIFNFDMNGIIIDCNNRFVEIIGSSRALLVGLDTLKLPDQKIVECVKGVLKGDITQYRDTYHAVTSEKVSPILGKFSPILSESGEIIGGTGIIEDITERKKLGDELRLKSLVLDQLEEHITITDLNGVITYVNRVQTDVLAYTPQEIVGKKTDVFGEDPAKGASQKEILEKTLENGSWQGEVVNYASDGRELIMDCRTQVVSDENGNPVALGGIAMDITARKKMEIALYNEKEQFRTTLLSVGDGVIATDAQGYVTVLNAVAENLTGHNQTEAFGKPLEEVFRIINEFTGNEVENPVASVLSTGEVFELSDHTILLAPDGTGRYIEDSAAPIKDAQGNITGVVLVFRDVTDKRIRQQKIEFLSYHDQLTGLHNRRYYEQEVQRLDKERYYPMTLVMADVNGLKLTNDAFGHDAGDMLLQKIADILKRECRSDDIVARIGGDEFVLLLPQTDAKNAETIIARINAAIAKEKIDNLVLSISVGYAVKDDAAVSMNEIFMVAEDAMYRNKLSDSSSMRSKTIDLIMNSLFAKNEREMFHSERVGEICEAIAKEMGFAQVEVDQIRLAGLMHDIGKIGISEEVLNKEGKLKSQEWNEIERHSEIGYRILGSVNEFSKIADYILEHHERVDGKGYPRGLSDLEISLQAKIIAVADAYDAMMTDRPYRKALTKDQAVEQLKKYSGTQFDRNVAEIFVEMVLGLKWQPM